MISANIIEKSTGKTFVPPYHIFERGGIKIGVFGLTAMLTADYPQAASLQLVDPILTAKNIVAELKDKCDFIIALTHIGYPPDLELAAKVPGIDVIIGGHSHTWLFEPTLVKKDCTKKDSDWVGGTVVCQDGEWGKALGRLDLCLSQRPDGRYVVTKYNGKLIDMGSSVEPAPDINRIIRNYSEK
jgi:2',3'-cyclic-nucleotide 2'-phosphodiesterase (5'-nucleotidase family)